MREDVVFTASASGYVTKASDSALENGDAIGIFALEPINEFNVKGTVKDGKVTLAHAVKWELNQTYVSRFVAYLPFNESLQQRDMDYGFTVKADQSQYSAYQASDLRYAVTDARPGKTVDLKFQHALSKLVVVMETPDVEVESVVTTEVDLGVKLNLADGNLMEVQPVRGAVTLGKAVDANGGTGHVAIMAPQNAAMGFTVTLKDGQVIEARPANAIKLESGIAYKATVGLTGTFTVSVTDWSDDGVIPYIIKGQ